MKYNFNSKTMLASLASGMFAIYLGLLISDLIHLGNAIFDQDIADYGGGGPTIIALGIPEQTGYLLGAGCCILLVLKEFVLKEMKAKLALDCISSAIFVGLFAFLWYAILIIPFERL